jgi:hypothetical protein
MLDLALLNAFMQCREDATTAGLAIYSKQLWHYTLACRLLTPLVRVNVPQGLAWNLSRRGFHHTEQHPGVQR